MAMLVIYIMQMQLQIINFIIISVLQHIKVG